MGVKHTLRRLGVGRLVYTLLHRPRAWWAGVQALGGISVWLATWRGERAMRAAVAELPLPVRCGTAHGAATITVHFLSGARFWHQTAFCAWSLAHTSGRTLHLQVYDDGSLRRRHVEALRRLFPQLRVHTHAQCLARLQAHLPAAQFPQMHALWHRYPNIRKLIDPHLAGPGPKLVLDSDMLFYCKPGALLDWLDHPRGGLHMRDAVESYGYPRPALERLAGAALADRVNVGITGLDGDTLDFARLEAWCAALHQEYPRHYFLEQALIAAWLAHSGGRCLPEADYQLRCTATPEAGLGCLEHYVAGAKPLYFRAAWRVCRARLTPVADVEAR